MKYREMSFLNLPKAVAVAAFSCRLYLSWQTSRYQNINIQEGRGRVYLAFDALPASLIKTKGDNEEKHDEQEYAKSDQPDLHHLDFVAFVRLKFSRLLKIVRKIK